MVATTAGGLLDTRGGRVFAAVAGLAIGLPLLFWVLFLVIPDTDPREGLERIEVTVRDARTGARLKWALVRVFRRIDDREQPEIPVKEAVDGVALLRLRPEALESEFVFVAVDASGYHPYQAPLAALIERGVNEGGDHYIETALTPE